MNTQPKNQKISILLSTYNGEKYIERQLKSLEQQTKSFVLYVRDDGSSDQTIPILRKWQDKLPLNIESGKNLGTCQSFNELLQNPNLQNTFISFCDQDDEWLSDKLELAIKSIYEMELKLGSDVPILYHSNLALIDSGSKTIDGNFWKRMRLTPKLSHNLAGLLNQPIVTGCTMVINSALYKRIGNIPEQAKMHDWWISLIACTAGKIISDPVCSMRYRLHCSNVIGASAFSFRKIINTLKNLKKYFKDWKLENQNRILQARIFLSMHRSNLNFHSIDILEKFILTSQSSFFKRKYIQIKYGFYQHGIIRKILSFFLF